MSVIVCGSVCMLLLCLRVSALLRVVLLFLNAFASFQILVSGVNLLNWLMYSIHASFFACIITCLQCALACLYV